MPSHRKPVPAKHSKKPLFCAATLMDVTYGIYLLTASLSMARLTDNPLLIGLSGTVHMLARITCNVIFGRLSDRSGRKLLMSSAVALFGVSLLFVPLAKSVGQLYVLYIIGGMTTAVFWPILEAWIGDGSHGGSLADEVGKFNMSFSIGMTLGPLVAGWLSDFRLSASSWLGFGLAAAITAMIAVQRESRNGKDSAGPKEPVEDGRRIHSNPGYFMVLGWLSNFANWTAMGIIRFLFPKLVVELGLSGSAIGVIYTIFYFTWFITFVVLRYARGWEYKLKPLLLCQCLGPIAFLGLWKTSSPLGMTLFLVVFGVSVSMTYNSSLYYCQDGQDDKGAKSGFHEMFLGVGMLVGPLIGGILAGRYDLHTPFLFCFAVVVLTMAAEMVIVARSKGRFGGDMPNRADISRTS